MKKKLLFLLLVVFGTQSMIWAMKGPEPSEAGDEVTKGAPRYKLVREIRVKHWCPKNITFIQGLSGNRLVCFNCDGEGELWDGGTYILSLPMILLEQGPIDDVFEYTDNKGIHLLIIFIKGKYSNSQLYLFNLGEKDSYYRLCSPPSCLLHQETDGKLVMMKGGEAHRISPGWNTSSWYACEKELKLLHDWSPAKRVENTVTLEQLKKHPEWFPAKHEDSIKGMRCLHQRGKLLYCGHEWGLVTVWQRVGK